MPLNLRSPLKSGFDVFDSEEAGRPLAARFDLTVELPLASLPVFIPFSYFRAYTRESLFIAVLLDAKGVSYGFSY